MKSSHTLLQTAGGLFTGIEDTYTESGNSTTITNKLATTSLQVQKIWTNDRNNVYGTVRIQTKPARPGRPAS